MRIDPKKFTVNEARSNPMVVAFESPDCPIKEVCAFMVVGFGNIAEQCKHLKINGDEAECLYTSLNEPSQRGR